MLESSLERRRRGCPNTTGTLAERSAPLTETEWRILHWLLRYPLQHADDVLVGVARWASRATVYRHVQALQEQGLVESVVPKTPGTGKRLYHLSNLGLHVLAKYLDTPARELARDWQADERGLLRLLPRLPTLLVLQDIVNGLITHAAAVMTREGRQPQLVRWTWQRDLTHRFKYREQAHHLFADGAVALCIRMQHGESSRLDQWYGIFLLSTELDDERLMRLRLERLLCWRESPERWPLYQHMLPVLILARSPRQCEHWQRAVETSALKLRLDPLQGALAILPPSESAHVNPWRLDWRTLSTDHPCHLQEGLRPVLPTAFPPSLGGEEGEEERWTHAPSNASVAFGPSGRPARLVMGKLASRATGITREDLEEREIIALLGLGLTPCHRGILHLLLVHPFLSEEELAGLLALQRKSARCLLYALRTLECLEPLSTPAGRRWHLCGRGLRLIATANHMHTRNIAVASDDEAESETSRIEQRGERWLLQHIQHTAGVYGFFATLAQAARQQPGQELCWWEAGAVCERRYRVGEQWYNLRPDALAEYGMRQRPIRFWLEWDCGTMNVRDLTIKFTSYAHYLASREWARESTALPRLLCVAPELAQERRIRRVAQARLTHVSGLVLRTTTVVLLQEQGPLAPIWSPCLLLSSRAVQPKDSLRRGVFETLTLEDDRPS